jgi:hypothetical protein
MTVMTWKEERDALIAQTMAFVQSVTGKPADFAQFELPAVPVRTPIAPHQTIAARAAPAAPVASIVTTTEPAAPSAGNGHGEISVPAEVAEPATARPHPSAATASSRPDPVLPERFTSIASQLELQRDMQTEIRSRVARFRAHQERFNRERQEYFSATLARLKASSARPLFPED